MVTLPKSGDRPGKGGIRLRSLLLSSTILNSGDAMQKLTKVSFIAIGCALLSGCVTMWGNPYHVDSESASGVVIRYDSVLIGVAAIDKLANESCGKYQKIAVSTSQKSADIMAGGALMEATYACSSSK